MVSYSVLQAGSFIRKRSSVFSMVMCLKVFFGCLLCLFSENGSNEPVILMQLLYAFHMSIKITVLSLDIKVPTTWNCFASVSKACPLLRLTGRASLQYLER